MKQKFFKTIILVVLLDLFFLIPSKATEVVGTTIEISESAINLFIAEQYNNAGIEDHISGSLSGVSYDITLYLPHIKLLDNQATVEFGFQITSNVFIGYVEFEDNLSFYIPSINELTIKGISNMFAQKVNSLNINTVLKQVIIATWNSLELDAYPMELAKKVENSEWLVERSIFVVDPYFSISFDVDPGILKIVLNTYLAADEKFIAGGFYENNQHLIKIKTGCQVNVKEFYIYDTGANEIAHVTNAGICPKNAEISIPLSCSPAPSSILKVLFTTSNTFYVRSYIINGQFMQPNAILN